MLSAVKATHFRCFQSATLELDARANLIVGPNAAGKTSLLEATAYLGRGKSFRGVPSQHVVQHGQDGFVVHGTLREGSGTRPIGIHYGAQGLDIRVDGETGANAAGLAEILPLQVVDPLVHELVAGGPEHRRRFLDWLVFHVEHGYLESWRRFRRALRQRNAALKRQAGPDLASWDREFADAAEAVDRMRVAAFQRLLPFVEQRVKILLGDRMSFEYRSGWPAGESLPDSLSDARARDLALGSTQHGPHRADIRLRYDERMAKRLVSRGQQKLLACGMVLAAVAAVEDQRSRPTLLLLDDPAAELDAGSLSRLVDAIRALKSQVIATALTENEPLLGSDTRVFHVEQGVVRDAD